MKNIFSYEIECMRTLSRENKVYVEQSHGFDDN
jgi:hypothetical protein